MNLDKDYTIIAALRMRNHLQEKINDLIKKSSIYCVQMDFETPKYGTIAEQQEKIDSWRQSILDTNKMINTLTTAISYTNLTTDMPVDIDGKPMVQKISYWLYRLSKGIENEENYWKNLTDKQLSETVPIQQSDGGVKETKIHRYYNQAEKDAALLRLCAEKNNIYTALEVANATTYVKLPSSEQGKK